MTVETMIVSKEYTDAKFDKECEGKLYSKRFFKRVITKDTDCYWINEEGKKQLLFKFRKNAIKLPLKNLEIIRDIYETLGKKNSNNTSSSFKNKTAKHYEDNSRNYKARNDRSKISGYYDRPHLRVKSHFKTFNVCRTTAFTRDHFNKWTQAIPYFEKVGMLYKRLAPKEYKKQINLFKTCPPKMQVGNSPFTTITSNYNWRTACHKDKGDYEEGLGNLTILGDDTYVGGYLGFPQFKVAIDVRPLDFVLMDVHQWHCNTELKADNKNVRLSFVCYFRKNMVNCNKRKIVNGELYYYKS